VPNFVAAMPKDSSLEERRGPGLAWGD